MQHCFGVSSNGRTRDFGSLYHGSNPCAPTTLRVCDASGGKPKRNSSREGVPHEVLTKCGRRTLYLLRHLAGFLQDSWRNYIVSITYKYVLRLFNNKHICPWSKIHWHDRWFTKQIKTTQRGVLFSHCKIQTMATGKLFCVFQSSRCRWIWAIFKNWVWPSICK